MTLIRLLPLLLGLAAASPFAAEEPLDPEQAYQFSARAIDAKTIEARWQIADGYYMYREKIRFATDAATVKLGEPKFPAGKVKDDEFFGRVETYRQEVKILIPVEAGGAQTLTLKANCRVAGIRASATHRHRRPRPSSLSPRRRPPCRPRDPARRQQPWRSRHRWPRPRPRRRRHRKPPVASAPTTTPRRSPSCCAMAASG